MTTPKIDREFASLIPPLSEDELAHLEASLIANGCREPIIVWKGHDILLDGHNRLRLCKKHDIKYRATEIDLPDREAAKDYIRKNQFARRNLTPLATSYLRGKHYLERAEQGKKAKAEGQNDPQGRVKPRKAAEGQTDPQPKPKKERLSATMGKEYHVGEKTIRRDGRFALAVDAVADHCGDDARAYVLSNASGLARGNVLRVSKLSPSEMKKYMKELMETGKRPRQKTSRAPKTIVLPREPKALAQKLVEMLGSKQAAAVSLALAEAMKGEK